MPTVKVMLKLLFLFLSMLSDWNKERKEKKKAAIKGVKDGLKEKDPSKITSAFDSLR